VVEFSHLLEDSIASLLNFAQSPVYFDQFQGHFLCHPRDLVRQHLFWCLDFFL
jgi:hypothetical protein